MAISQEANEGYGSTRIAIGAFAIATAVPMVLDFYSFSLFVGLPCMLALLLVSVGAGLNQARSSRPLRLGALFAPMAVVYFFARLGLAVALFAPGSSATPPVEWIMGVRTKLAWMCLAATALTAVVVGLRAQRRKVRPDVWLLVVGCLAGPVALADAAGMALELPLEPRRAFVLLLLWVVASCIGMLIVAFGRESRPRIPPWRERFYGWMSVASGGSAAVSLLLARLPNTDLSGMDVYHLSALGRLYPAQGDEWRHTLSGVAMAGSLAIAAGGVRILFTSSPLRGSAS